jgi:adenylate kinase family enzyme
MNDALEEEDKIVDSVLSYWFEGDQQTNYKTKWFPEGSTGMQAKADNEVRCMFGGVFESALAGKLMHWQFKTKSCVALIVILDQFSRHICRLEAQESENLSESKESVLRSDRQVLADKMALDLAQKLHGEHVDLSAAIEAQVHLNLPMAEYVFSLMPLRHTATVSHLSFVLERLQLKEKQEAKSAELLQRFRKQTVRRLQHLQDREKVRLTVRVVCKPFQAFWSILRLEQILICV